MELPERDQNGKYPSHAFPGGYPIIYFDKADHVLCAKCASKDYQFEEDYPVVCDIYWEGETIHCSGCNREIESAYGNPSEEEDN